MRKRIFKVSVFVIIFFLALITSIKVLDIIHFKCIFRNLFNIYCVGCGTTRMLKCIFKLKFKEAFMYNPLVFILLILFLIYLIYFIAVYIKTGEKIFLSYKVLIIIALILLVYMLIRNLPQFYFLQP